MKINNENELKGLDDFNLRGADDICHNCDPHLCDDQECEFYMDFFGPQIENPHITYLKLHLKTAKGKAKRKIRRQLKRIKRNV